MDKKISKAEIAVTKSAVKTLRTTRRSIMFLIRTILLVLLIVLLCFAAFISTSRLSNSYILVNEGMPLRAASMLHGVEDPDLAYYFTADCIAEDATLRAQSVSAFQGFSVSDYEYDLIIDKMHVLPWQASTYVDVTEQINAIKATFLLESGTSSVPEWTPIRYRLYLQQVDGRWYISTVELLEVNPSLPAPNTPDPNQSPLPMATPTPEPTPIAFQVP